MTPLLIFDLDGTLIDSKKDIVTAVNFALAEEGLPTLPDEKIEDLVGKGAKNLIQRAIGNPSDEQLGNVFVRFWNYYHEHLLVQTELYPGARKFLEDTSSLEKAVVTNKPHMFAKKILEGLQIDHHFRWLIGGDSLPIQKPDPKVFDPIFQDIGKNPDAIMIGDSKIDIECGRAAGLLTCAVTFGFRPREELEEAKPDFMVDSFEELAMLDFFRESLKKEA